MIVREAVYDVRRRLKESNSDDSLHSDRHIKFVLGNEHAYILHEDSKINGDMRASSSEEVTVNTHDKEIDGVQRFYRTKVTLPYTPVDMDDDSGVEIVFPELTRVPSMSKWRQLSGTKFFKDCSHYYRVGCDLYIHKEYPIDTPFTILIVPHISSLGMDDKIPCATNILSRVIDRTEKTLLRSERLPEDKLNDGD